MNDAQTFQQVGAEEIVDKAQALVKEGYRLIQLCCTKTPAVMDLVYTFEKENLDALNFRMPVNVGDTIASISETCHTAFLYENEIHDLYGVNFSGMIIDFQGTLYQTAVKQAFSMVGSDSLVGSDNNQ